MKIVFFGTSEFAIPALSKLFESGKATPHPTLSPFKGRGIKGEGLQSYEIVAVITQPDKPAGRHLIPTPSPVKVWALEHGLKIFQPESLEIGNWKLEIPVVNIVASYGKLIPKWLIDEPKQGTLNIHPSLLPKYRGPSPIHAAILNGDTESGVTIIKLDEKMDHGPIVAQEKLTTYNLQLYYKELHDKLAELGAKLLIETLPKYVGGEIKPVPQDDSKATFTKLIVKANAKIDWAKSALEIDRKVRAYHLWPVAWTTLNGKRLKIFRARIYSPPARGKVRGGGSEQVGPPGTIDIHNQKLLIHCGRGVLEIEELQLEGSTKLSARDFLRGQSNLKIKFLQ